MKKVKRKSKVSVTERITHNVAKAFKKAISEGIKKGYLP